MDASSLPGRRAAVRSLVVGTAGHIDHGKSALVRALTGTDPDRLKEEKQRGITIDLGFAHWEAGLVSVAFVDVPGHERFVKNMLAGASGIDLVLLVVAADESVMPQTREHFDICRLLRVQGGIVALTKADLVDQETLELVRLEVRELVAGSFLEHAPIVPVSSRTGEGLDELRRELEALGDRPGRAAGGPARLPVDRVFSVRGFGTVATGTLASGRLGEGDELAVLPAGRTVKIRGVQVHGADRLEAAAGQRVAVNLGGVQTSELARGDTLCAPGAFETTRRFDARLELLPGARPLRHGTRVRFHHGTAELLGRVAVAGPEAGQAAAPEGPAGEMRPGSRAFVRVRLEAPAVLTRHDRFILRAYSPAVTIAGGQVLDPQPPRGGIRTPAARARFARLSAPGPHGAAAALFVEERGGAGLPLAALVTRAGVAPAAIEELAGQLTAAGQAVRVGSLLVAPGVLEALGQRLVGELQQYHRTQPLSDGLPREEARERLFRRASPEVFERVLEDLSGSGRIVSRDRLALGTHRITLSADEARARETIERLLREAGLKAPDAAGLAAMAGVSQDVCDRVLKLLLRQKVVVRLDTLVFHSAALDRLKHEIAALKQGRPDPVKVDVAAFKERYGITRKFAIPLLEFLDRERVTRRVGEARIVL